MKYPLRGVGNSQGAGSASLPANLGGGAATYAHTAIVTAGRVLKYLDDGIAVVICIERRGDTRKWKAGASRDGVYLLAIPGK